MQNNIIRISNFQNRLNNLFTLTGFYFKSKVVKFSHKGKNMFFNCWVFLLNICISDVVKFFLVWWLSWQLNFSVAVRTYEIHVFDEEFFLLIIRMPIFTKHFRVMTYC